MKKLTVPDAARRVGRDPETVRRWIRSGKLRSEKVGTQHLIGAEELTNMLPGPPLDLPEHWQVGEHGPIPNWETIVRDGRASH